ncbi:Uncharacterised protein [Morganella morganii]|uniref:Uncharacterized protein n=1 Tax=Morganella morganii subsp. morganii KT TaxID=1124991 RepID=M1SE72_MORMO|nr:hypothetical protein MU9_1422 [Morganella morganii subsp. morganii KT]SQL27268.1 Uncharacterised protein [Morganella morganii]STZ13397.1 Uncharacterised protein [Morganella morganii]
MRVMDDAPERTRMCLQRLFVFARYPPGSGVTENYLSTVISASALLFQRQHCHPHRPFPCRIAVYQVQFAGNRINPGNRHMVRKLSG